MVQETTLTLVFKKLFISLVKDIFRFPVWWYTKGLLRTAGVTRRLTIEGNTVLGVTLWLRHLFTPMYGQADFTGRLISFFIRFVVGVFRIVLFILWALLSVSIVIFWIGIPVITLLQIFYQLSGNLML